MTIEAQNTDKLAVYLQECRDRSIPVLPPDINKSQLAFTVTPEGVRFGLTAVKNVGEGAIASILGARAALGRITSLHALCETLDLRLVNKRVFESLVKAGAFDSLATGREASLGEVRARLMATIDLACEYGVRHQRDRELGQAQLFGGAGRPAKARPMPSQGPRTSSPGRSSSSSVTKKRRSVCTSAGIPSIAWRPS